MQTCSQCQTGNPDTANHCKNCGADLSQWANLVISLKEMQENQRISHIRIAVSNTCCPACARVEGVYEKEVVPRLPVEGCSHNLGCRCYYMPVLAELYP